MAGRKNTKQTKQNSLKELLKTVKLNESIISMVMGLIVLGIIGILVFNYFNKSKSGTTLDGIKTVNEIATAGQDYIVAKGDNLWKIAEKAYGTGYKYTDIAKENNLTNPGEIEEGQKLSLPKIENKEIVSTENKISGENYTVVKGDNLWKIAVRAYGDGYRWTEIAQANKLVHPSLIHSGNTLVLPR